MIKPHFFFYLCLNFHFTYVFYLYLHKVPFFFDSNLWVFRSSWNWTPVLKEKHMYYLLVSTLIIFFWRREEEESDHSSSYCYKNECTSFLEFTLLWHKIRFLIIFFFSPTERGAFSTASAYLREIRYVFNYSKVILIQGR